VYTDLNTFLYQGSTGLKFPISPTKEILESMVDDTCFLLTGYANSIHAPIIESGNPDQCDALKQKIKNKDRSVFPNHNTRGKPAQILDISPEFTRHNIFTYVSSRGELNFISDNHFALEHFSDKLHRELQDLSKQKEEEGKKIRDFAIKPNCFLLLDYEGDGFGKPIIEKGYPHQCQALKDKIENKRLTEFPNNHTKPGNPPPQILELHQQYTDVGIFLYITSTGEIHFISDDGNKLERFSKGLWEVLHIEKSKRQRKHKVDQCFLKKLNSDGKTFAANLTGNPTQCKALEEKIANPLRDVFGDVKIYEINPELTKLGVFTYISRTNIAHIISVKQENLTLTKYQQTFFQNLDYHFPKKK